MAHPRPYQSEYDAKYLEYMAGAPLPTEKTVAGLSSMETLVAREPAFTHKRRVELANVRKDQVAHAVDFTGQRTDTENPALRYKTGVRRSTDRWPTEYKLQYGWKASEASAPLLQAQEALDHQDHHPACPRKPVNQGDQDKDSQDDQGDCVRSIDGSCDSHQDGFVPVTAAPTSKRPATAKQRQTLKQKIAACQPRKQPARVPLLNMTKTKQAAPVNTKNRPKIAATQTHHKEVQETGSDSDTDSQTGQKPQKRSTSSHYKCEHKKKRKAKRKLIWPMTTEYQRQFKLREQQAVVDNETDQAPAGSPQKLVDSSDPRLLKHSPLKLFKLQPETTKFTSEYLANFQAPTKLCYKEGAWCGVSPPQLLPQQKVRVADDDDDATVSTVGDWFNQVLELRRAASSYRKRSEGTHFVQVHLADIEGVEDLEEATSTVSTCSICRLQQQPPPPPASRAPPTRSHDLQDNDDDGDDTESVSSSPTASSVGNIVQPIAPKQPPIIIGDEYEEHSDHEDVPGRLPTPELKKIPPERKIRHHLDRTTPCKGAILTSPPKNARHGWNPEEMSEAEEENDNENPLTQAAVPLGVTKVLPKYHRDMTSRAPIYPTHSSALTVPHTAPQHTSKRPDITATKKSRTFKQAHRSIQTQTRSAPTNKPTVPSRRVRPTDGGNEDLECSFCGSPLRQPQTTAHRKARLVTDNRHLAAHKSSTTTTLPTRAPPQQPRTTNLPLAHHPKQRQRLSESLLSLSSCSVASEVLERAQRRKETFWSQRETAAT